MIALVRQSDSDSQVPASDRSVEMSASETRSPASRRPYDWSNIVFAVDYCEKANREYEAKVAG